MSCFLGMSVIAKTPVIDSIGSRANRALDDTDAEDRNVPKWRRNWREIEPVNPVDEEFLFVAVCEE